MRLAHLYFNSHAHVERDLEHLQAEFDKIISTHTLTWSVTVDIEEAEKQASISTHTLTWSVTSLLKILKYLKWHFNSHAHVERDLDAIAWALGGDISTHTLTWSVTR